MIHCKPKAAEAARFLRDQFECDPEIALLTGTGLADSTASLDIQTAVNYKDIPHFPISTVYGHPGRLIFGKMKNRHVVSFQGRCHLYEGYSPVEVAFPVRVMHELGVKVLILTNAAGGLNLDFTAGDIMVIHDHINLTGSNPLAGPNEDSWGPRFPDMTRAYDAHLQLLAKNAGEKAKIHLQNGIYAGLQGPSLETSAEIRFLKTIGADAVGFSTVQEVIAAVHSGINVLGLSTITNINNPDDPTPAVVDDIIAVAGRATDPLRIIIEAVVEALPTARA